MTFWTKKNWGDEILGFKSENDLQVIEEEQNTHGR